MGNRGDFGQSLGDRMTRLGELAATPLGACLFIATGFAILGAGYLASARIFTKRDLSRLP